MHTKLLKRNGVVATGTNSDYCIQNICNNPFI